MLINMSQMLDLAKQHGFAVGAFNVSDSNLLRAVIEAAEMSDSPPSLRFIRMSLLTWEMISRSTSLPESRTVPFRSFYTWTTATRSRTLCAPCVQGSAL